MNDNELWKQKDNIHQVCSLCPIHFGNQYVPQIYSLSLCFGWPVVRPADKFREYIVRGNYYFLLFYIFGNVWKFMAYERRGKACLGVMGSSGLGHYVAQLPSWYPIRGGHVNARQILLGYITVLPLSLWADSCSPAIHATHYSCHKTTWEAKSLDLKPS